MKKILSFIGGLLYSVAISYLLWLLFHFLTPFLMSFEWKGFIYYMIFGGGILTSILLLLCIIAMEPTKSLVGRYKIIKIVSVISLLLFGFSSVADVWRLDVVYSEAKLSIAISVSIMIAIIFIFLIGNNLFQKNKTI